jgi:RNA 2',3'-cyclic 3'-phosphodiesterase
MRAFVGIDFNREVKATVEVLQKELKQHALKGRWKYHDNFNLTLKFFNEINQVEKTNIDKAVTAVCENIEGFRLAFGDLGVFEGRDNIRVLWIGMIGNTSKLIELHQTLDNSFTSYGFLKEKRSFKPHVTIGQDLIFNCTFENLMEIKKSIPFPEIVVDKLHLFRSEQIGNKRVYTKIKEYKML